MNELPITGYLDRFSHRSGEPFVAHVSMREPGPYRARLVRVISADPNPAGPGMRFEDLSYLLDEGHEGRRQDIGLGSHGVVEASPARVLHTPCTWTLLVQTGLPTSRQRCSRKKMATARSPCPPGLPAPRPPSPGRTARSAWRPACLSNLGVGTASGSPSILRPGGSCGGAVFSVGSITFCGSLWRHGFEGPVSRIVENVVRRFSAAPR